MVKRSTNMEKPNEIWSKSSASKKHHNLTEKDKNKQLQSTKNYNKTRNELVKKHPLLNNIFNEAKKRTYKVLVDIVVFCSSVFAVSAVQKILKEIVCFLKMELKNLG